MRRHEKEVTDPMALERIIDKASVCRLGLFDTETGVPYIVPLSFGYQDGMFVFHAAETGYKIDLLKRGGKIAFEIDNVLGLVRRERACGWTMRYQSIIGWGNVRFIEAVEEKKQALQMLLNHYGTGQFFLADKDVERTTVFALHVKEMRGKTSEPN
ncbi:MAG: pyridoxamine 5'-phosphate oxidase family protein [Desulfuromonas sp.]|nr:MAG: pyridoxamine 5'-phosphate oxidase family protein [Desulfuromonas sp.]